MWETIGGTSHRVTRTEEQTREYGHAREGDLVVRLEALTPDNARAGITVVVTREADARSDAYRYALDHMTRELDRVGAR